MKKLIWASCLLILPFCSEKKTQEKHSFPVIKVKEAFDKKSKVGIKELTTSIEYIPLETNDLCLIGNRREIFVDELFIIVIAFRQIFVFDRLSGKFIREISTYGKGPGEYVYTLLDAFNPQTKTVCAKGGDGKKFIEYDLSGLVKRNFFSPIWIGSIFIEMEPDIYAGYTPNSSGEDENKLIVFNAQGKELYRIINNDFYKSEVPKRVIAVGSEALFYTYEKQTYFKEIYNDTLYSIANQSLKPEYIFDGEGLLPYYAIKGEKEVFEKLRNLFKIEDMFETEYHLFFTINYERLKYAGYFDKNTEETVMSNFTEGEDSGFYDDFNDFVSFVPQRINLQNELAGYIDAQSITTYYAAYPEKSLNLPTHLQNIDINDNPIVVVAKLK